MVLNLEKGANINLNKTAPNADTFRLGLGWDIKDGSSTYDFDLDAFALITDLNDKVVDVVYFNQKKSSIEGFMELDKDNLTGEGQGADENILLDTKKFHNGIKNVYVGCNIFENVPRGQNFGQVNNAFIEVGSITGSKDDIIARYDLSEDSSTNTYFILGRLYLHNGEVKFQAIERGGKEPSLIEIVNKCPNF